MQICGRLVSISNRQKAEADNYPYNGIKANNCFLGGILKYENAFKKIPFLHVLVIEFLICITMRTCLYIQKNKTNEKQKFMGIFFTSVLKKFSYSAILSLNIV